MKDFFRLINQSSWIFVYYWQITLILLFSLIFFIFRYRQFIKLNIISKLLLSTSIPFIIVFIDVIVWKSAKEPYATICLSINSFLFLFNFLYQLYLIYKFKKIRLFIIPCSILILIATFITWFISIMYIADDWI